MTQSAPDDAKIPKLLIKLFGFINKKWAKEKPIEPYPESEFMAIAKESYATGNDAYLDFGLDEEETTKLRLKARKEGVSVNSVLVAASIMAKNRLPEFEKLPDKAGFAVDIRRKMKKTAGEACTILATSVGIKANIRKYPNFWDLTRDIQKQTDHAINSKNANKRLFMRRLMATYIDPTFSDAMYLKQIGNRDVGGKLIQKLSKKKMKIPVAVMITNLGGMPIPANYPGENALEISDAVFLPPIGVPGIIELGIASLRGRMHILIPARKDKFNVPVQKKYMEELIKILKEILE
jgi:hypothetical protein